MTDPCSGRESGFALIASLSIMAVLVLIGVALFTLASVATRNAELASARVEAEANAKMALMLAIGDLQKNLGPDQRISANASILDTDADTKAIEGVNHPFWTGVWDAWVAGDPDDAPVNPAYPNRSFSSGHQTLGSEPVEAMRPQYEQRKSGYFRGWLVSLEPDEKVAADAPARLLLDAVKTPVSDSTGVRLVGEGSLGPNASPEEYVGASLLQNEGGTRGTGGRYAWWIGDQSQKASILADSYETGEALTESDQVFRLQAPATMGHATLPGFELFDDESLLGKLASYKSLDLIVSNDNNDTLSQLNFHSASLGSFGVLADVREGGLKRDLSTLLERPININDNGDEFMLYKFNGTEEQVPIQDLSAYYQLYRHGNEDSEADFAAGARGGIHYDSVELINSMQVRVPDYGDSSSEPDRDKYLRQYTAVYRSPVPVRIHFILAVGAKPILDTMTEEEKAAAKIREEDTHRLLLGVMPVICLWNPNNVPMVWEAGNSQIFKFGTPPFALRWRKYRDTGGTFEAYTNGYFNLNWAMVGDVGSSGEARSADPYLLKLRFAENEAIIFEPGEVKLFSLPVSAENSLIEGGDDEKLRDLVRTVQEPVNEWDPRGFLVTQQSARVEVPEAFDFNPNSNYRRRNLVFKAGDLITIEAETETDTNSPAARLISHSNEIRGGAFNFSLIDEDYETAGGVQHFRNYQAISRFGGGNKTPHPFNIDLMLRGFPGGEAPIDFEIEENALSGADIIGASSAGEVRSVLIFSMMAGCEIANASAGGFEGGRRITSRPFLHSSALAAPIIDSAKPEDIYNVGWEWQLDRLDSVEVAIQENGSGNTYYGGGYSSNSGSTHVIQQFLPVVPPVSIGALSHARLGGFSLARNTILASPEESANFTKFGAVTSHIFRGAPEVMDLRQVTATGHAGLAPHTLQAVGNSYAHPNIPPDKAFTDYTRYLNIDVPEVDQVITFADHSYLANKALWDDFFFSSITPQSTAVELFETGSDRSAVEVAERFFFDRGVLPNRRILPYTENLQAADFATLAAQYEDYLDGFADKIASHLLMAGSFNVNSTSVEAWEALFSSLRGKPVAFFRAVDDRQITTFVSDGETPISPGDLPTGDPVQAGAISADTNAPESQWLTARMLSEDEIGQLAQAMVREVKRRGPFLSLSEFINRRLLTADDLDLDLAVKGALQAALDFEGSEGGEISAVSINAPFREPQRNLASENLSGFASKFPEALQGPVAYGSTPYVDQADVLRHVGSALTPRGDTFVIRSYGDKADAEGRVIARAWCEAIVQRTPDYLDQKEDENYLPQNRLTSETNRRFGRKFEIISFRWLDADEV